MTASKCYWPAPGPGEVGGGAQAAGVWGSAAGSFGDFSAFSLLGSGGGGGSLAGQLAWASMSGERIPVPAHHGQSTVLGGPAEVGYDPSGAATGHTLTRLNGPAGQILAVVVAARHEPMRLAFPR